MSTDKMLRYGLLGGIFLVPFMALVVANSLFFPFISGKNFLFRFIVELLFAGWLILALYDVRYRPSFSWLAVSIAAFVGVITLAGIFGENPFKSIWSNFERMEGVVGLVHLLMYFIVAGTVLEAEKLWNWFWNTSIGVSMIVALYGILQLAGKIPINQGDVRVDATLGNATYLGVYMLFHVFITAILFMKWRGASAVRYLYAAAMLVQLFVLYHTATRGAILGFLGGALLTALLIAVFERERLRIRNIAIGVVVGVLVLLGSFFAIKDTQFVENSPVLSRFSNISFEEGAVDARFIIWGMAYEGFKERPILGWGQENFNLVFNKYYDPVLYDQEPWFDRVHNILFDWLIAGGILGFLAYFAIPLFALYYLWRRESKVYFSTAEKSLLTGLGAGYFFNNLFVFDNLTSYILFFSLLAYIYARTRPPLREGSVFARPIDTGIIGRLAVPVVIVLLVVGVYFVTWKSYTTNYTLLAALSPQPEGGVIENIELFEKAAAYGGHGKQEVAEQFINAANSIAGGNLDISIKQRVFDSSLQNINALIDSFPPDARLHIFRASLYSQFGQRDETLADLERASELSPGKQIISVEVATLLLDQGRSEEAFELFKKAFEADPSFEIARIFYAAGAIIVGDDELTEALLVPHFGTVIVDDNRILNAYVRAGRFDRAVEIWKLRVEKNQSDPQARLSLAAAYIAVGEREQAIAEIETVIEFNPQFKEQGELLIGEIRAGRNPVEEL